MHLRRLCPNRICKCSGCFQHIIKVYFWSYFAINYCSWVNIVEKLKVLNEVDKCHVAKKSIQKGNRSATTYFLLATLFLGISFVYFQFNGFKQLMESGYFFAGAESNIATTFLYVIATFHLFHIGGGLISLLIIIYNHFKQKYNSSQTLGIELGAMYWHFLDFLWIVLFLFLYFFK